MKVRNYGCVSAAADLPYRVHGRGHRDFLLSVVTVIWIVGLRSIGVNAFGESVYR